MNNDNWLNLELTQAQLFEIEKLKRIIPRMSRGKLEEIALEAVKNSYGFKNAFISVVKNK